MSARRLLLLALSLMMILVSGCIPGRITGRVMDSDQTYGIDGVVISLHQLRVITPNGSERFNVPQPGDTFQERPEALEATVSSQWDGSFSMPLSGPSIIGMRQPCYRVRFHRADYHDATFDFTYEASLIGHTVNAGIVKPRPRWLDSPTTRASE